MDWHQAQARIREKIKIGTDVNTPKSSYRFVTAVDSPINSSRYGYYNEYGFIIPIGQSNTVKIPWSMLKECFAALNSLNGYDGTFFKMRFPLQAKDHPCHVHVVGQLFVKAGIAQAEDGKSRKYRLVKHS